MQNGPGSSYNRWVTRYVSQGMNQADAEARASRVTGYSPAAPLASEPARQRGFTSGVAQGAREGVGSMTSAVGSLTGGQSTAPGRLLHSIGDWVSGDYDTEALSGAGRAGRLIGRAGAEIGMAMAGGGAALKGATMLPRVGSRVARALESGSRAQRGLAFAVAGSPVDVVQGFRDEEGLVLPGTAGAVAENLLFSGAAGALLPARRAARAVEAPEPITDRRRLLPERTYPAREVPETRPERLIPRYSSGPVREAGGTIDLADFPERLIPRQTSGPIREAGPISPTSVNERLEAAAKRATEAPAQRGLIEVPEASGIRGRPGSPTFRWDEKQGRFVIVDRRTARRVADKQSGVRAAEESAELRSRLGGAGPQVENTTATRQLEAMAEAGRRMREAQGQGNIIRNEIGAISADALAPVAGGLVGGAVGAGVGEDPLGGAITGAAVGAGLGFGAVRGGDRLLRSIEEGRVARAAEAPAPQAAQTSRVMDDVTTDPRFDRIDRRSTPYPADLPQTPRTAAEVEEFMTRMERDPGMRARVEALYEAGEIWQNLQKTSLKDVKPLAEDLANRIPDLALKNASRPMSGPEIWALEIQMPRVKKSLAQITEMKLMLDPASEAFEIAKQHEKLLANTETAILRRQGRELSEWGLTGRIAREARKRSNDSRHWIPILESAAGRELTVEEVATLVKSLADNNIPEVQRQLGKIRQTGLVDQARELYTTGLLTQPMRPVRDVLSSVVNSAELAGQQVLATQLDRIARRLTGVATIDAGAWDSLVQGARGASRGLKQAEAIFKGQGSPEVMARAAERYDLSRETVQSLKPLRWYTTMVRRSIGGPDQISYEASLSIASKNLARAYVSNLPAVKGGTIKRGSAAFDDLVQRTLQDMPLELSTTAKEMALQSVFQNSTMMGNALMGIRQSKNALVRALGTWVVPFIQTPASITTQTLKGIGAPVSFVTNATKAAKLFREGPEAIGKIAYAAELSKAQREAVMSVARGTGAYGWIALGYALGENDKMTGWYPWSDRERRRWETDGRIEGAIKVGQSWVATLGLLGPQAQLMTIGASIASMLREQPKDAANILKSAGLGIIVGGAATALDSPMLQGPRQVIDLVDTASRGDVDQFAAAGSRAAQTFLGGTVPQFIQTIARSTDVDERGGVRMRQTLVPGDLGTTAYRSVAQGIPGLRQTLPTRRDPLGRERAQTRGGFLPTRDAPLPPFFSPARLGLAQNDPVAQELWRTNAALPRAPQRPNETDEEYEARATAIGDATYSALERTMQSPGYRNIGRSNIRNVRSRLERMALESGADERQMYRLQRLTDEEAIDRLRGMMLEDAARRARSRAGARFQVGPRGRDAATIRALSR